MIEDMPNLYGHDRVVESAIVAMREAAQRVFGQVSGSTEAIEDDIPGSQVFAGMLVGFLAVMVHDQGVTATRAAARTIDEKIDAIADSLVWDKRDSEGWA